MSGRTVKVKCQVHATVEQIFYAFTNATAMREWMCEVATVEPRLGGRFFVGWAEGYYGCGEYTLVEPGSGVGFSWLGRGEPGVSQVKVLWKPGKRVTRLTLTHTASSRSPKWAPILDNFQREWQHLLENLVSVLETGQDLRITRRPMLGINLSDFTAEQSAKLGVPVNEGLRLDAVVDGFGAKAAGLEKNDVIVGFNEKPVVNYGDFGNFIRTHQAGDVVAIEFYRGKDKKTLPVKLSARQIPEMPATAGELAETLKGLYQKVDEELVKLFEGVSEEQAGRKPAPKEWSAKEILAHIIHAERDTTSYLNDLIAGQERVSDSYADNFPGRVAATVVAYPTVSALLQQLKNCETETVAMIASIPDSFVKSRRGSFWRIAYQLVDIPEHTRLHFPLIREAITAG